MSSIFESTLNTRAILQDSYRFIRSDVPDKLTGAEIQWLVEHGITTIVDLRGSAERENRKCPLENDPNFCYFSMPVTGGNRIPRSAAEVPASYIKMADHQMSRIIDVIWHAKTNVLYFCNVGKDRTGVVSAILLSKLGADHNDIIADYMLSKENLSGMLKAFAEQNPQIDVEIIMPQERYMDVFLKWLEKQKQLALK